VANRPVGGVAEQGTPCVFDSGIAWQCVCAAVDFALACQGVVLCLQALKPGGVIAYQDEHDALGLFLSGASAAGLVLILVLLFA